MSDAGGYSGRNADRSTDRSAGDGAASPESPVPGAESPAQPAPGGQGGGRTEPTGPDEGPRPPSWRALITGLLIALVMASIMVTTYVSAQHAVVARDLPWGVTGSSPLTTAVQEHVSLKIHRRRQRNRIPAGLLRGRRPHPAPVERSNPDPQHALLRRQRHHPAAHRPEHLRRRRSRTRHPFHLRPRAVVAPHQATPAHQSRRTDRYRRHPARMNRPRPASRRRGRTGQAPCHPPAGCICGSDQRCFARLPVLPDFPGSARGTT
jgi:hypothetical protein